MLPENADVVVEQLANAIIYEDSDVVVIDKPVGLAVHGDGEKVEYTVADWLLSYLPAVQGVGETMRSPKTGVVIERSGVVHRLDRATSGVLLLAKHQSAYEHCKRQFHDRLVKKTYQAIVYGQLKERWGTIDRSIGRSARDWRLRSAERGAKGQLRSATTDWERQVTSEVDGEWFSSVTLHPHTGRMHQLRVHCKAIGRPIVGDTLYAPTECARSHNLGLKRLALHAFALEIEPPAGNLKTFIAPIPADLQTAFARIAEE